MLYAVVITGVYPPQCVTVWDRKESCDALAAHLSAVVSPNVTVKPVDSFFPAGMAEPDTAWLDATNAYLRGDHINTTGENEG